MSEIDIAKQSARGTFSLFLGNLGATIISAIAIIAIARLLGPDAYGTYTLVLVTPNVVQTAAGLGIGYAVTRFAAYHRSRGEHEVARRMTTNALMFIVVTGAVLSGVTYLGAGVLPRVLLHRTGLTELTEIASALVLGQTIFQAALSALIGWSSMGAAGVTYGIQAGARLVVAVGLILLGFGVYGAVVGHVASMYIAGALSLALLFAKMGVERRVLSSFTSDIRTMLVYSMPLFVSGIAVTLSSQYVLIVLANVGSNASVGFYQSATNVIAAIGLTSASITSALFPAFAHLDGADADTGLALRYAVKYMGIFVAPLVFFLVGTAPQMVDAVYGPQFGGAASLLVLLSLAELPLVIGLAVIPQFMNGIGRTRLSMLLGLVSAAAQVVFAPLLALGLGLGVTGIAYSIGLTNTAAVVVGLYILRSQTSTTISLKPSFLTLVAAIIPYFALLGLGHLQIGVAPILLGGILVYLVLYLVALPLTGALSKDDIVRLTLATEGMRYVGRLIGAILKYETRLARSEKSG